tara:strand:+ start:847 stop:1104 length:258 start_codon:yes stop_codon:yes gene_type:complete
LDFRIRTIERYGVIFGDVDRGDEVVDIVENKFEDNWAWFGILHRLTGGDITKLETITKKSLYESLTWLTYEEEVKNQQSINKSNE